MLEPFVTSGRLSLQNQRRNKKVSLRIEATAVMEITEMEKAAVPLTGSPARSGPDHVTGNGDLVLDRATRNGRRGGAVAETASGTENEANEAGAVIERRAGVLKGNERLDPGINYLIESYFRCEIMQKLP